MTNSSKPIPVLVAGALGSMGSEVIKAIKNSNNCELVSAIDTDKSKEGEDIGTLLGIDPLNIYLTSDFEGSLCLASQNCRNDGVGRGAVLVDFTHPKVVYEHTRASIAYGVHPVIGTTGLTPEQVKDLSDFASKASIGSAIIPNFSVGMVLLQQAASTAANFYDHVELIESHHNRKADSPSGTCLKTAEMIEDVYKKFNPAIVDEFESLKGVRGGKRESGIRVHSIRNPGLVAHQEVIFGSAGETYILKHDTIDRKAYMPGVLLVVGKVRTLPGLVYGLEKLI